ncbi:MAG TPA: hypothetical protein VGF45_14090, partial [Polyangia bacterium]
SPDIRLPDAAETAPPMVPTPNRCGVERPDVSALTGIDGLTIDADGTIYYNHMLDGWEMVGRVRPGGAAPEPKFVPVVKGATPWGIAVDSARRRLYAASAGSSTIFVIDLKAVVPSATPLLTAPPMRPNDLALAANGDVYYTDQSDSQIYRIDGAGTRHVVTPSPVGNDLAAKPSALAFGPTGDLFVGAGGWGNILRITLSNGVEGRRQIFGAFVGWANGFAFDERGRLYISLYDNTMLSDVVRLDPSGNEEEVLATEGRFSSVAFGRGALPCSDLFVADLSGGLRRLTVDSVGLRVP